MAVIEQSDARNTAGKYTVDYVRGISTGKEFIETKANMDGVNLTSYKIVYKGEFAYVADTSRRGDKIALAFNTGTEGRYGFDLEAWTQFNRCSVRRLISFWV